MATIVITGGTGLIGRELTKKPQHLQQADRYVEKLIQARTSVMSPYPWGMIEMKIDRDLTQQGRFGLRSAVGLMPDGTPFDAPNADVLPTPVSVPDDAAGPVSCA